MAGTRGGLGRIVAMAVGLVICLCLWLAGEARGGTYEVAQCGWGTGAELDLTAILESRGRGVILDSCARAPADPAAGLLLEAEPLGAIDGGLHARWQAASGTGIVAVRGVWAGSMMPGFRRELGFMVAGSFRPSVSTSDIALPGPVVAATSTPEPAVGFRLVCTLADVPSCRTSPPAWTLVREVMITVTDPAPPVARLSGPLVAAGWHRGRVGLELVGDDAGAGVERLTATADGVPVAVVPQPCSTAFVEGVLKATAMRPCGRAAVATVEVDTAGLPDGVDSLRGCAADFTGAVGCAPDVQIEVDNSPPSVAFSPAGEGRVAATVADPYSGPASGSFAVRRADADVWTDLPTEFHFDGPGEASLVAALPKLEAGAYVVRAEAADALGNAAASTMEVAEDGDAIRGAGSARRSGSGSGNRPRPRRGHRTRLLVGLAGGRGAKRRSGAASLTLPFGGRALVRGRLIADAPATAGDRTVRVISRPAARGAGSRTVRTVRTDSRGRFSLRLPPGTSRSVTVAFRGGDGLAPSRGRPLALRVRAAISLVAAPPSLRTGEKVHFVGAVRRGRARLPTRGKLVAIQYLDRAGGRWRPALVVRTGAKGHFHADYRFRYITGVARIHFRATALPEAGWPYAPGSSPPVTVEVDGR